MALAVAALFIMDYCQSGAYDYSDDHGHLLWPVHEALDTHRRGGQHWQRGCPFARVNPRAHDMVGLHRSDSAINPLFYGLETARLVVDLTWTGFWCYMSHHQMKPEGVSPVRPGPVWASIIHPAGCVHSEASLESNNNCQ